MPALYNFFSSPSSSYDNLKYALRTSTMLSPLAGLPEGVLLMIFSTKIPLPTLRSVMPVPTTQRVVLLSILTILNAFTTAKRFLHLFI